MTDPFLWLADWLERWPERAPRPTISAGCHLRLADCLEQGRDGTAGGADLAVLIRQVVRRQNELGGGETWLRVPAAAHWPSEEMWRKHGLVPSPTVDGRFLLRALHWRPGWLVDDGSPPPAQAAEAELQRRTRPSTEVGDAFLEDTIGQTAYTSPGQEQAMRTVLASEDTATIVVNLPTGTGKSSVFLVPGCLWSGGLGVTVVIVPTTALALDQERGIRAAVARGRVPIELPANLAFHSGLTQEERSGIYQAIRAGSQTILLSSPEALTASLSSSLYAAARSGYLRGFAIDEAHLVAQWGADFRPDFQAAAGLRSDLLRVAAEGGQRAFKTILLTGTLTEDGLQTLLDLYGRPGPVEVVSSVSIRAEPSYWIRRCADEGERSHRLLEAVAHLPRPLIVYTTRVDEAYRMAQVLRQEGYGRVAVVTGESSAVERRAAIEGLTGRELISGHAIRTTVDLVVATSAFGLGIDQPDVRSVIHVCVPETVDRYYQEVGRGGRDGRACVSLVLFTDRDIDTARSLSRRRIIGIERGFERWQAMMASGTPLGSASTRLELTARPADLLFDSEHNEDWNLRTLTLMSRAGMIDLEAEAAPPRTVEGEAEGTAAPAGKMAVVRLLHGHLADRSAWEASVRQERQRTHRADARALDLMLKALRTETDLAEVFQEAYRINLPASPGRSAISVLPQRSCGGCPNCRNQGRSPYEGVYPRPEPVGSPKATADEVLLGLLADGSAPVALLTFETGDYTSDRAWFDLCQRLATLLVRHGVRNIVAPVEVLRTRGIHELYRGVDGRFTFLFDEYVPQDMPCLPTLIVQPRLPPDAILPAAYFSRAPGLPLRIILSPSTARDPERTTLPASSLREPTLRAESALGTL